MFFVLFCFFLRTDGFQETLLICCVAFTDRKLSGLYSVFFSQSHQGHHKQ